MTDPMELEPGMRVRVLTDVPGMEEIGGKGQHGTVTDIGNARGSTPFVHILLDGWAESWCWLRYKVAKLPEMKQ